MTVTAYSPFAASRTFFARDVLDELFSGFAARPTAEAARTEAPARPRVDVSEVDGSYVVRADLPGVKKEDIAVTVEGDVLSISAESKADAEQKEGDRLVYRERSFGKWSRSFRLGAEIDFAAAVAKYENGVLALTLPKRAADAVKKLTIQ
ncbi:MAG: Hsp20/alpha crystallin family protein [Burkholderiales bacterium]